MDKVTKEEKKETRGRRRKVEPAVSQETSELDLPLEHYAVETSQDQTDVAQQWYVIHTYSGYEGKVKRNLEHRIQTMDMQDKIFQVIVPTEEEIEVKDGQRKTVQKKVFPGYVLVETKLTNDTWNA